jgi:hypothetical protein
MGPSEFDMIHMNGWNMKLFRESPLFIGNFHEK